MDVTSSAPSSRPGMGSTPFDGGVTFRLWAPDAAGVSVIGEVTGSVDNAIALSAEPGGLWSADVVGAQAGQSYQYVLTFPATMDVASTPRVDPYARLVVNDGNDAAAAIVYDESDFDWGTNDYTMPNWRDLVIYELHVASFDVENNQAIGTLNDVGDKLEYLQSLGVSAIELMPIVEYEGTQSWGYNPGVPFAVETSMGGPTALKELVKRAHALGIAVLLDVVYNHFGPDDSVLWGLDTWPGGPPGGAYFYPPRYPGDPRPNTPWGSRPDYGRPEVRSYLRDNARSWLRDSRIDGLRFDATAYIRNTNSDNPPAEDIADGWLLLQEINDDRDGDQPWKLTIAEDLRNDAWVTNPTSGGGAGFTAQWDADFNTQVRDVVEQTEDSWRDLTIISTALTRSFSGVAYSRVVYTESHDADGNGHGRVPTEIDPADPESHWAKKRSTLAAAVTFSAPGIPMIFQGQEILYTQPFIQGPAPIDWTSPDQFPGIRQLYTDLIAMRRNRHGSTAGLCGDGLNVLHLNNTDKLIAYHRWSGGGAGDDVVVVCNFADQGYTDYRIGAPRAGTWRVRFNSDSNDYDAGFTNWPAHDATTVPVPQDGLACALDLSIGPYTALVLSQDPQL